MRVERLRVGDFGRLHGLDTGEAPLPSLVAVYGPNEAGKTTFFQFLTTLLYGFQPASRDAHPYAPWSGADVEGEARIVLEGGETWEVRRRLLSSPSGSLVRAGLQEDLRNRALPCVEHVPRAVFRQVFALTLAELAGLEGESWAAVQDRLLGAMGATDLRPARVVAAELEREAGELWRPNRRGKQRVRDLRSRLSGLRLRREGALARDRELRDAVAELEARREELRTSREERSACRIYLERHRALLPVRAQLRRIAALEREAGDDADLQGMPTDPAAHLRALQAGLADVEERLARTVQEMREPKGRIETFGAAEERLVRAAERIRALNARALSLDSERVRRGQLEQELRDLERRAEALAAELFGGGGWSDDTRAALAALPLSELRDAVRAHEASGEARRVADAAAAEGPTAPARGPSALAGGALLAMAAALLVAGLLWERPLLAAVAAPLAAAGAGALALGRAARREDARADAARARGERTAREHAQTERRVGALLAGLPLRETVLAAPDAATVLALERLLALLRDDEDRRRTLTELMERGGAVEAEVGTLARELRVDVPPDPLAGAHLLAERAREADSRRQAADAGRRELERLTRERTRLQSEQGRLRAERDLLVERLERLGAGDRARGLERAAARTEARSRAARLADELSRAHPDLKALEARIAEAEAAGEDWTLDEGALARHDAREEELTERIEALVRRTVALQHDVERLGEAETADAVEGEILMVEEELAEARRARDRLWVLARLVREAERRFREAHQPDILREAGAHLASITAGRYARILMEDEASGGGFLLRGPDSPSPVRVDVPISTGTREQVYLALRLAIVDHLDQGGERLPLFMDEAFVNWDPSRMGRGLDLVARLAERRQVFLFSCHPEVVERVRERGARVVELERAG